jgi:hypothetical protein
MATTYRRREGRMRCSALLLILASLVAAVAATEVSARHEPSTLLDGRWKLIGATTEELIAKGLPKAAAERLNHDIGIPAMEYHNGQFRWFDLATGIAAAKGTYAIDGNEVTFTTTWQRPGTIRQPRVIRLRWRVFRDRLTFSDIPGRPPTPPLTIKPWVRVH